MGQRQPTKAAPVVQPVKNLVRPAATPAAAPSMGRAMTVASPAALTLAKNLRVNPNNPTAASSVPYVEPELKKPTWGDNLVTGGLRYLMDPAIDFTAGVFPLTAPFAIPASAAAAGAGENWAQQYEIGRGLRTEESPTEVALASAFGLAPLAAGTAARIGRHLISDAPALIKKQNVARFWLSAREMTDYRLRNELTDLRKTIRGGLLPGEPDNELARVKYNELYQQYVDWIKQSRNMDLDTMKAFDGKGKGVYSLPDIFKYSSSSPNYLAPVNKTISTIAENLRAELSWPLVVNKRMDDATKVINEGYFPNIFNNVWGSMKMKGRRVQSEYERWNPFPDNYWDILGRLIPEQIALIPKLKALIKGAELSPDRFPVYGFYQNPKQLGQADTYGPIQMMMKDDVKLRPSTTYTSGDSLNQGQMPMPWSNQSDNAIAAATGPNGWAYIQPRGQDYARPPLRYPDLGTMEQHIENKYLYGPYNGYAEAQFFPRGLEDLKSVNINTESIPLLSTNIQRDLGNFQNLLTKKGIPYTMQGDYGDAIRRFLGK